MVEAAVQELHALRRTAPDVRSERDSAVNSGLDFFVLNMESPINGAR